MTTLDTEGRCIVCENMGCMGRGCDFDGIMETLEDLRSTHGIMARWTGWTQGHQGGAFVLTDRGWQGGSGEWRKTAGEALIDALQVALKLRDQIEAERAARAKEKAP